MAKLSVKGKKPGPKHPEKYPFTGPAYDYWGEIPGFVYIPSRDQYYENTNEVRKALEEAGAIDKPAKQPGLIAQIVPAIATAGAIKGAEALGSGIFSPSTSTPGVTTNPSLARQGWDWVVDKIGLGGPSTTTATTAAAPVVSQGSGVAASAAQNAAGAATPASTGGGGLFSGLGSTATNALGAAGVGLGAYGALQGIKNKDPVSAGLGGAGVGLGLNTLGYSLGPVGWAATLAVPAIAGLLAGLGDKDRWKEEGDNLRKLREQGVYIPDELLTALPSKGRSKQELINIARATGGNEAFANSRNESDLTGKDIVGYSAFAKRDPNWFRKPLEERISEAQSLLDQGLIRERRGQIEILAAPKIAATVPDKAKPSDSRLLTSPTASAEFAQALAQQKKNKTLGLLAGRA